MDRKSKLVTLGLIISLILSGILYYIDDDAPHPNVFHMFRELIMMTLGFFGLITILFFIFMFGKKMIKKLLKPSKTV